ncbi:MAG TPA: hypothetical protein VFF79_03105 [Conexibacter sp.]|jgi:hypothetical protein|nr:hypothetical protein [Conexibacter sp.]
MPFNLSEYDRAFGLFAEEALRALAFAGDPLLSDIEVIPTKGALGSVIQDQDGRDVDLAPQMITSDFTMSLDAVRDGDLDALVIQLDAGSAQLAEGYHKALIATMRTVTDATGNVAETKGPLTFEALYCALDRLRWSLNADGELSLPTLVVAPEVAASLPELTPEQHARLLALHERKRNDLLARRRRRRLS